MNLADRLADLMGRCPHCPLTIRFRGVSLDKERSFRRHMDRHTTTQPERNPDGPAQ